jgi:hypothetical protein
MSVVPARSEADLAEAVRSLPAPVALTSQERRLARPLEIHSGLGRLRPSRPRPVIGAVRPPALAAALALAAVPAAALAAVPVLVLAGCGPAGRVMAGRVAAGVAAGRPGWAAR